MAKVHEKAKEIEKYLKAKADATVEEIAAEVGILEQEVVDILDSHHVAEDGRITNKGVGQGGDWHPAREAEKAREAALEQAQQAESVAAAPGSAEE